MKFLQEPAKVVSDKEMEMPWPTLFRAQDTPNGPGSEIVHEHADDRTWRKKAKVAVKELGVKDSGGNAEEDEDEDIGIHMWEKRGNLVMEVPWFRTEDQA